MKEYNKEKLHEYAKELFALCLENGKSVIYEVTFSSITVQDIKKYTDISEEMYNVNTDRVMPIWELIEKVKQL